MRTTDEAERWEYSEEGRERVHPDGEDVDWRRNTPGGAGWRPISEYRNIERPRRDLAWRLGAQTPRFFVALFQHAPRSTRFPSGSGAKGGLQDIACSTFPIQYLLSPLFSSAIPTMLLLTR